MRDADETRAAAIAAMFERHRYDRRDAVVRARVLYFSQIGYYALELGESLQTRLAYAGDYVFVYTGVRPSEQVLADYVASRLT